MQRRHVLLGMAALPWVVSHAARAQLPGQQQLHIQLQYHEAVAAGADLGPAHLKIYQQVQKDCDLAAKAFSRKCIINQVSIFVNPEYGGNTGGGFPQISVLNGTANLILIEKPAGGPPPCPASPVAPAARPSPPLPR